MTKEISATLNLKDTTTKYAHRTKRLVHFYRAVALFTVPIRSSELGLRRRK